MDSFFLLISSLFSDFHICTISFWQHLQEFPSWCYLQRSLSLSLALISWGRMNIHSWALAWWCQRVAKENLFDHHLTFWRYDLFLCVFICDSETCAVFWYEKYRRLQSTKAHLFRIWANSYFLIRSYYVIQYKKNQTFNKV